MTAVELVHWAWRSTGRAAAYDLVLVPIDAWEGVNATAGPQEPPAELAGVAKSSVFAERLLAYWPGCSSMIPAAQCDPTEPATAMLTAYIPPDPLALTAEECDRLVDLGETHVLEPDALSVPSLDLGTDLHLIDPAFRARLTEALLQANAHWWRLDVVEFSFLLLRYDIGRSFPEHQDMHPGAMSRKLAATYQISDPDDYEGGDLLLRAWGTPRNGSRARGSVTVFPGWCPHEVTEVTAGTRWSLVAWGYGPPVR